MRVDAFPHSSDAPASIPLTGDESWRFSPIAKLLPTSVKPAGLMELGDADLTLSGGEFFSGKTPAGMVEGSQVNPLLGAFATDSLMLLSTRGPHKVLTVNTTPSAPFVYDVRRNSLTPDESTLGSLVIHVAPGASLVLYQRVWGNQLGLTSHALHLEIGAGAKVEHVLEVHEGLDALHVATLEANLARDAELHQTILLKGGKLVRCQWGVTLSGENAEAHLASLSVGTQHSQHDVNARVRHLAPHTRTTQLAKNLLRDESKGIFTGRIYIAPGAQKVEANQLNRNLLLSPKAHAIGQPQLEIFADDVKCAHGSSTGQIQDEALFYLRSRGISLDRAQGLMTEAFVTEVIHHTPTRALQVLLRNAFQGGSL